MAKAKSSSRGGGSSIVQGGAIAAPPPEAPKKRTSPMQFINQVRAEGRKITWPSRKETWITSVMVFIMVVIASLFFWVVDLLLALAANQLVQFGR
jgi:preprotein translocase subunit SecE